MWHSCVREDVAHLFEKAPHLRPLFDDLVTFAKKAGPFRVIPQKTRIVFLAKTRFAGVARVRKDAIIFSLGLPRPISSRRFLRIEHIVTWYVHQLAIRSTKDLDAELAAWIEESYEMMGLRRHLGRRGADKE